MFVISRGSFFHLLFIFLLCVSSASEKINSSFIGKGRALVIDDGTIPESQMVQMQSKAIVLLVPLLGLLAFLIGLPSNTLALWVLLFRTKKLPSTILLINLTTCDILFLLVLPFRIVYHFQDNDWTFGEPFCRIVIALFYGNMYGSVMCLALIAVDRYIALVHPFGAKTLRSNKNSLYMSILVWLAIAAGAAPLLSTTQSYETNYNTTTCHDALPSKAQEEFFMPYFVTLFSFCFLIPFLVVVFSYGSVLCTLKDNRQRHAYAVRVTVLMLMVFLVCFLPSNVLLLLHYSKLDFVQNNLYVPYLITLSISTFNSCIDPFIFYYVSKDFRKRLCEVLNYRSNSSKSFSEKSKSKGTLTSILSKTERPLDEVTAL